MRPTRIWFGDSICARAAVVGLLSLVAASVFGPAPPYRASRTAADSWMGWSNGHWEGDTLVVDVTCQNEATWFDRAGNFHSDALHVVERYTPLSPDTLNYEATIEDRKVFSRPWKISMPLYRHVEKNARLVEFECVEFVEELLYGPYRKKNP